MILDVYGREVEVSSQGGKWRVFYLGADGKRRTAKDIVIPDNFPSSDVVEYIAGLCHEWARPSRNQVLILSK